MAHSRLFCLLLVLAFACGGAPRASAQELQPPAPIPHRDFDFYQRGPFRDAVPRPEAILGYPLGSRETTYMKQDRVVTAIADAARDRVRVIPYGTSMEGRGLRVVAISSPENMQKLDAIRASNARLADPRNLTDAEANRLVGEMPVIVWINENIHGNESASFESGMQLIYQLAASEEPKTLEILRNCVVVVNPTFNPDGHERFTVYHDSIAMGDPNNDALEHDQPWAMYGRYSHYRFDMNRDKLATSQPEVRAEIAEYLKWNPQVYVDQHGQVTQYFFPPVALPINVNTDIPAQQKWLDVFGRSNAAAFDRNGWGYYTRKVFDFFYVGYLDEWSALNGAIGMTYETDGGGQKGWAWRRDDGTILTLRDGVAHHFVTALATLEASSANREAKLRDYVAFRRAAIDEGKTGAMKSVVLLPGADPGRAAALAATLRRSGVEVGRATANFRSRTAHGYAGGAAGQKDFPAGAYVVDMAQPQGRLARAFLEPDAALNPEFVQSETEKRIRNVARGKATTMEDAGFYDITAWSLPYAHNVEAYWTEDPATTAVEMLGAPDDPASGLRSAYAPEGRVVGGRGTAAYLFSNETDGAPRLALGLLREGFRVAAATAPIKAGGRTFPRGTFVVRTDRNLDTLAARVAALARETGVDVTAVDSQYADESTVGVGSEDVVSLKQPRVLVCAGDPVSQESYGWIWYLFEREMHYPFTAMDVDSVPRTDLTQFDVIVLPDGSSNEYARRFGADGVEKLKAWANAGGVIVGLGSASLFLSSKDYKLTTAHPVGADDESAEADASEPASAPAAAATPAAPQEKKDAKRKSKKADEPEPAPAPAPTLAASPERDEPAYVPGAIFRARVDHNYFMSFGYDEVTLPILVNTDLFLEPSDEGANVITFGDSPERLAGWIWPNNTLRLMRGTSYLVDEPTGNGHVILFSDDPNFRRIWRGTTRLFMNSIVYAPSM